MKKSLITLGLLVSSALFFSSCVTEEPYYRNCGCKNIEAVKLKRTKLYVSLPDYAPTPDAFAVAPNGDIILSCPNFADTSKTGCLLRITKDKKIIKIANAPVLESTQKAYFMGLAFDDDGYLYVCDNQGWTGTKEGQNKGRLLRLKLKDNKIISTDVIAYGMCHPNGVRFYNGYLYVTQSMLPEFKTKKLSSGVYKFKTTDRNIRVKNRSTDENLIFTAQTQNEKCQYGLDGLVINNAGNLFVGDFGDGTIYRLILNDRGDLVISTIYTKCPNNVGIDGIDIDAVGNLYIAGFSRNSILKVTPSREVQIIAQYPDNDGSKGQIDQCADVIVYGDKLLISNFDCVTDSGKTNRKHDKPYTVSYLKLD
ncbi:phage head-tail adapter protein [Lentisphaerota bacterium WC36G]|nr:phage head-tail adapter protein [Lentisphaerae bacterium WC36]